MLDAAHFYATKWEFDIIERENTGDYELHEIRRGLQRRQEALADVEGLRHLALFPTMEFVEVGDIELDGGNCTESRGPPCSAICSYRGDALVSIFTRRSTRVSATRITTSPRTVGHDLPEALDQRDIISPVKRAATGLDRFVKDFEREEMERRTRARAHPKAWQPELACSPRKSLFKVRSTGRFATPSLTRSQRHKRGPLQSGRR